jgi:hypothetical protein
MIPDKNLLAELEPTLRRALQVPGPDAEFLARLRTQLQEKAKPMQPQTRHFSPRLAWGLAAALLVLAVTLLATSPSVVEAMKRLFGYVPGAGLVEQGSTLRVLAEPVVVERDGITLTVTQAIASPDKTILSFKVENIPESALARDNAEGETQAPRCNWQDYLRLPDGTIYSPTWGQGGGWYLGFEYSETFAPLPENVNTASLLVSCLIGTSPGAAPENWVIPLTFVPAPPDMTIVPVIEITSSPVPAPEPGIETANPPPLNPITLERVIELDDGYILIGSLHSITTPVGLVTLPYPWNVRIIDATGQDVPYDYPSDVELSGGDSQSQPWAYKVIGKVQAWPLSITIDEMEALLPEHEASFEFDTGPAPQTDQVWTLNQDVQVGGYTVRILEVIRTLDGYAFNFQADPTVTSVSVEILGYDQYFPPSGGGGGRGIGGAGTFSTGVAYSGQVPEGRLTVVLTTVTVLIPGPWSLQWQPENAVSQATPAPSSGPAACLTDKSWAQDKASIPAQIPSGLGGNFAIFGPNADGSLYGVSLLNLADSSHQFISSGAWPIISPDGAKIVFTGDIGLVVYDIASGQSAELPGTTPEDYRMVWSPDSSRIAFIRSSTGQMMVINADGTGQQQVADLSVVYRLLVGWADNTHLLIAEPGQGGAFIQSMNLADGSTENWSSINLSSLKANAVISADGQWVAYTSSRGGNGMLGNGLFVARLDGTQQRMVAALDGAALYFPVWSPDNEWLIVSVPDLNDTGPAAQALIELDSCRVIPLPDLNGEVYSWGR